MYSRGFVFAGVKNYLILTTNTPLCMCIASINKDVDQDNIQKLNCLAPHDQQVTILAIDNTKDKHTRQVDMTMPKSKANTGGLASELHLAVEA